MTPRQIWAQIAKRVGRYRITLGTHNAATLKIMVPRSWTKTIDSDVAEDVEKAICTFYDRLEELLETEN